MTLILDLPQELERELAAEAARRNLSLSEYVVRLLSTVPPAVEGERPRTGAELVAYWRAESLIGTRPDVVNAQQHARALRREAEWRKRE